MGEILSCGLLVLALSLGPLFPLSTETIALGGDPHRPLIRKLGTVDLDMVEATPVVFRDRLYRSNTFGRDTSATRPVSPISDFSTWRTARRLPPSPRLSTSVVPMSRARRCGSSASTTGTARTLSASGRTTWSTGTSVQSEAARLGTLQHVRLQGGRRYVMAIEVGKPPEVVGVPFTMRFAESENLLDWRLLPTGVCLHQGAVFGVSGAAIRGRLVLHALPGSSPRPEATRPTSFGLAT